MRRSRAASLRRWPCSRVSWSMTSEYSKAGSGHNFYVTELLPYLMRRLLMVAKTVRQFQRKCRGTKRDAVERPRLPGKNDLRGGASQCHVAQHRGEHVLHIAFRADVSGPGFERRHPEFLIRNPVGANNRQGRELAAQIGNLCQTRHLDVEDDCFGPATCHLVAHFVARMRYQD